MKRHVNRKKLCDISNDLKNIFDAVNWKKDSLEKIINPLDITILENNIVNNEVENIFTNLNTSSNEKLNEDLNINNSNDNTNLEEDLKNKYNKDSNKDNKEYKCNYCTKIYSRKDSLTRHLESCLVKYFKENQIKKKIEQDKLNDFVHNKNSLPPSKNLQVVDYNKRKKYQWELYSSSLIPYQPNIEYNDFSYYKGVCLIQMPFEDEFRDNHISFDTKIRLFTSVHYPSLLYELLKNQHNINVVPENKETSIVYKKNGFVRVNNDFLTLETTLKLKKYFLKNYLEIKNFHPLIDSDIFSVISEAIYRSIIKNADIDHKSDYLRIFEHNREFFNIEEIIQNNKFLIEDLNMKDFILKKQFIFF